VISFHHAVKLVQTDALLPTNKGKFFLISITKLFDCHTSL